MAARVSGYYGYPFQGSRGVTHGEPLPPRILNIVLDMIVRHWVELMVDKEADHDGFRCTVSDKVVFLRG